MPGIPGAECYGSRGVAECPAGEAVHEFSLAQDMVETLRRVAMEHKASRVAKVRLRLGDFTHVDPETLTFAFEVACRGTVLEGCRLEIQRIPTVVRCPGCGWEGGLTLDDYFCPACGRFGFTVVKGREIELESMDIPDVGDMPAPSQETPESDGKPCTK